MPPVYYLLSLPNIQENVTWEILQKYSSPMKLKDEILIIKAPNMYFFTSVYKSF
jgi:hypothetical protein